MHHLRLPALLVLALMTACPGGGGGEGGDGDGDGDGDCDASADIVLADIGSNSVALAVSDPLIAYVTRDDVAVPTELHVVGHDGTGETVLYSSPAGRAIESIAWAGADLLFIEGDDGANDGQLFRIAASGGAPAQIGTGTFVESVTLLGVDGGAAFVLRGDPGPVVDRVDLALGDVQTVGTAPGSGTPHNAVLHGGEIFFVSGEMNTVYALASTDSDVDGSVLFDGTDHPACGFPLGGLVATPTTLVCGFTDVETFARNGDPLEVIIDSDVLGAGHIVVAADGENVYMVEINDGTVDRGLRRVDAGGGDVSTLACDLGQVSYQTASGWFPVQTAYQIGVGGGRIVWVDERVAEGATARTVSIRSVPL